MNLSLLGDMVCDGLWGKIEQLMIFGVTLHKLPGFGGAEGGWICGRMFHQADAVTPLPMT